MEMWMFNFISNLIAKYLPKYKLTLIVPIKEIANLDDAFDKNKRLFKEKPDERVEYLVMHTTAGNPHATAADIQNYFLTSKPKGGRGWSRGGYHFIIEFDGGTKRMYPDSEYTNGVRAKQSLRYIINNKNTMHVSYTGGIDMKTKKAKDTRTKAQKKALENVVKNMILKYPNIKILGHNQVAAKACPSFNVPKWLREIGVAEKNIAKF